VEASGGRSVRLGWQWCPGSTYESIPRPEGHEETKPTEEEDSSVHVDDIEEGNGASLVVDRIDLGGLEQNTGTEHLGGTARCRFSRVTEGDTGIDVWKGVSQKWQSSR